MGSPELYNLVVDQDSTFRLNITWTNPDSTPINLTGARVLLQIRTVQERLLVSFDSASLTSGQHLGALNSTGVINITLDDEVTKTLPAEPAVWDILVDLAGVRDKLLFGNVSIRSTVTRIE